MTHAEALEHHRRQLHSEPECYGELRDSGVDACLPLCRAWKCSTCGLVLVIDPTGVIRERRPLVDGRD